MSTVFFSSVYDTFIYGFSYSMSKLNERQRKEKKNQIPTLEKNKVQLSETLQHRDKMQQTEKE